MSVSSVTNTLSLQAADASKPSIAVLPKELFPVVLSHSDPLSVGRASQVCKVFNAASKQPSVWKAQFARWLPKVKPYDESQVLLSHEGQFKKAYRHLFAEPRAQKIRRIMDSLAKIELLRGSTGLIDKAYARYRDSDNYTEKSLTTDSKKKHVEFCELVNNLHFYVGPHYDGTEQSIAPRSWVGLKLQDLRIFEAEKMSSVKQGKFQVIVVEYE